MDLVRQNSQNKVVTIPDILFSQAKDQPDNLAIIDEGRTYTYSELFAHVICLIEEIESFHNKTIAILLSRSANYLISYFAGLSINGIIVPVDPGLTQVEIYNTLVFCKCDLVIYSKQFQTVIEGINIEGITKLCIEEISFTEKELKKNLYWPNDPSKVALLLHTSGSLANPKRVMLSHGGLISNAVSHALHMELEAADRVLIVLPMHFGYCNTAQILTHFLLGGRLVIMSGIFTPHRCLRMIEENEITTLTAVPTMLIQLQNYENRNKYNISSLRQVSFGGAPFPEERLNQLIHQYPHVAFCQTYGQTEAGPRITGVRPQDTGRWKGSVGTPIPNVEVKVFKENGDVANIGEIGEIVVKSPSIMSGYFGSETETARTIINGWLYTGDLGYLGLSGEYYLVGRKKNFIIRGGINIYPEEIESTILQFPSVQSVIVYGVSHPELGEIPHAYVVMEKSEELYQSLKAFMTNNLALYKIPVVEVVDELPRTYNGKLSRGQLGNFQNK